MNISEIDKLENLLGDSMERVLRQFLFILMDLQLMEWDPLFEDDKNSDVLGHLVIEAVRETLDGRG